MIQAIGKNILVVPVMDEKKGLILTTKEEKPKYWNVISVGGEVKSVSNGDNVFVAQYGFQEIVDQDQKYYICKEENIYAKKT